MLIEYIKNIPIFKHLKEAQLKEIASRCKSAFYKKGDAVFYKTDLSTDLYIVVSGRLKAVLIDEQGSEIVLAYFESGNFFGEFSLLDGKGRSATIVADEDSELAVLKRNIFLDLLLEDSKIAVELMITLVERLRNSDAMIESLAFLEVSDRLIKTLLNAAEVEGKIGGKDYLKSKRLTHKELASRIGASREAVSKCMKVLVSKGVIKEHDDYILIARDAVKRSV